MQSEYCYHFYEGTKTVKYNNKAFINNHLTVIEQVFMQIKN